MSINTHMNTHTRTSFLDNLAHMRVLSRVFSLSRCQFPDGTTYDLTAMTRTAGRSDYVGRDKLGNMYYMNVCGNVQVSNCV